MSERRVFRREKGFGGFDDLPPRIRRRVAAADLAGTAVASRAANVFYWMEMSGRTHGDIKIATVDGQFLHVDITFDMVAQAESFNHLMQTLLRK